MSFIDTMLGFFKTYRRLRGGKWEQWDNFEWGLSWERVDVWRSKDRIPFLCVAVVRREDYR